MFYVSLLDDYHGLTNRAFQIRASYNAGLSKKAYNRMKDLAVAEQKRKTDDAISQGLAVGFADNYNQQYWLSHVVSKLQGLQNRNRCVGALSLLPQTLNLTKDDNNLQSIPKPADLHRYINDALRNVEDALESIVSPDTDPADWKYYDAAEVTQEEIYCVPLKMPDEKVAERHLPLHDIGLTHFRPRWILCEDPAANRGSYAIFHKLYETLKPAYDNNHYMTFRFDRNIYEMFLKVSSPRSLEVDSYNLWNIA
jgi:hypothetical protein